METFDRKSIVAFIDILGFKELVRDNKKNGQNIVFANLRDALLHSYRTAIYQAHVSISHIGKHFGDDISHKLKYAQFSDCIFISYDYELDKSDYQFGLYWIIVICAHYQRSMATKQIYLRGGIADGQNYFDNRILLSEALIKAYELESKIAKYPRIIIEDSVIKYLNKEFKEHIFKTKLKKIIVKDWMGIKFINPYKLVESFRFMIENSPEIVHETIELMNSPGFDKSNFEADVPDAILNEKVYEDVLLKIKKNKKAIEIQEKYKWLKEFLNWNEEYSRNMEFQYLYK